MEQHFEDPAVTHRIRWGNVALALGALVAVAAAIFVDGGRPTPTAVEATQKLAVSERTGPTEAGPSVPVSRVQRRPAARRPARRQRKRRNSRRAQVRAEDRPAAVTRPGLPQRSSTPTADPPPAVEREFGF